MSGPVKTAPRLRNAAQTRARILSAAQLAFSSRDYSQAKVSEIAAEAGVNQALVIRYFESKEKLFETALIAAIEQRQSESGVRNDRSRFGEGIAEQMIELEWSGPNPLAMAVHAASNLQTRAIATTLMSSRIVADLAEWLGEEEAAIRATEVLAMCAGLFTYRRLLPLDPLQGDLHPDFRRWFVATVQAIIDREPEM